MTVVAPLPPPSYKPPEFTFFNKKRLNASCNASNFKCLSHVSPVPQENFLDSSAILRLKFPTNFTGIRNRSQA